MRDDGRVPMLGRELDPFRWSNEASESSDRWIVERSYPNGRRKSIVDGKKRQTVEMEEERSGAAVKQIKMWDNRIYNSSLLHFICIAIMLGYLYLEGIRYIYPLLKCLVSTTTTTTQQHAYRVELGNGRSRYPCPVRKLYPLAPIVLVGTMYTGLLLRSSRPINDRPPFPDAAACLPFSSSFADIFSFSTFSSSSPLSTSISYHYKTNDRRTTQLATRKCRLGSNQGAVGCTGGTHISTCNLGAPIQRFHRIVYGPLSSHANRIPVQYTAV